MVKEEKRNIYQRLHAVMEEVSYVQKENKKVNNQYSFVSHDAVTSAVRSVFMKHGVFVVPSVTKTVQSGNRTEIEMTVDFINVDNDQEHFSVISIGHGVDSQDKGPGKAMSYAFKYALLNESGPVTLNILGKNQIFQTQQILTRRFLLIKIYMICLIRRSKPRLLAELMLD